MEIYKQYLISGPLFPSGESTKAMKWLDGEGINYYSLMDDREAHLKTLAFRKIRLEGL